MNRRFRMKIRAGETFLYRKEGTESQVFEIRMKSDVNHSCIQRAARLAYRRYPYFKSRFKTIDGISLQMMSVGDTFTIDFQQNFPDATYAKAFLTEASKTGLTAHCSDVIAYTTPKDHTANTNFIKSLIGFFRRIILR